MMLYINIIYIDILTYLLAKGLDLSVSPGCMEFTVTCNVIGDIDGDNYLVTPRRKHGGVVVNALG